MMVDYELLEFVSSLICLLEEGRVAFLNRAGQNMLGLPSLEQAIGRQFDSFIVEDYRFLMEAGWELLAEEDVVPLKLQRSDGVFDAEMRVRCLPDSSTSFLIEVRDISKFVRSATALREREERLHGILRSVAEGIITLGETGIIESANPAAERMFGFATGQMIGKTLADLLPPQTDDEGAPPSQPTALLPGQGLPPLGRTTESLGMRRDGRRFPMEIAVSELRHGRQRLFTAILRDISERKEHEDRIRRLAHHDALTGLPNRNLLNDRLTHALARIRRHGGRIAVLYVDLDRFKPINDTLGHEAGDQVLCEVAARLSSTVRSSDTVARVGGDEFVVVTEEICQNPEAGVVARKILTALSRPFPVQNTSCTIGASIGIAVYPDDGNSMEEVCKAADTAMYRVKHSGRNGFCFYSNANDGTTGLESAAEE